MRRPTVVLLTTLLTLTLAHTTASAGGLGIPTSHVGLGLGNLQDFTGVRLNWQDRDVQRVDGLNITVWAPAGDNRGTYRGLGLHLVGAGGDVFEGIHLSGLGLGAEERARGIFISGLGMGGGDVAGISIAGLGMGADRMRGVMLAGLGVGAENLRGIAVAGLGVGAEDVTGLVIGGLGVGAEDASGIMIGGLGVGGEDLRGLFFAGLGVGASSLQGLAASGAIRTKSTTGAALGVAYQRTDVLYGVSTGIYNRADEAHGLMIGLVNQADVLHGVQIGLVNHVGSGPAAARWLPLINARF